MSKTKKITYILAIILSIIYLLWRVFFTIPWQANIFVLIFALLLVISELISNFTAFILIFFRLLAKKNQIKLTIPEFEPNVPLPAVDIIIVTHNEDSELLRKTINAATFISYPEQHKVNIVVADDGNRPEIAQLAAEYQVQYIGMDDNKEAKSGNINHALEQLSAPLFAIFDADMIPFSGFLTDTVPLFMQNFQECEQDDTVARLGFVQTPQSFYNADIFQFNLFSEKAIPNEQDFFSRDVNVLNGTNQTALFTGSNAVFLRSAVDEVGGFPTDTLTEDFELGTKINIAGYTSLATSEPQSSGITPIDLKGVIKQRTRWARGVIQSCHNLHIFINPKLPFKNRLILINSYFYWWSFFRRMVYMIAPILYALFKIQVVNANFWILMLIWAPGYFLLHYVLKDTSDSIRNERWGEIQETFFAPYLFIPVILETLRIKAKKFKVTTKNANSTFKDKLYILPYLILWLVTLAAIIKFNYGKFGSEILVGSVITFWLLMHFINLSFCLFIAMGRPVYRKSERFSRQIQGTIQLVTKWLPNQSVGQAESSQNEYEQYRWLPIQTLDVSEGGLSFFFKSSADDEQLEESEVVPIKLQTNRQNVALKIKIMRISQGDNQLEYSGQIVDLNAADRNQYFQLIYDGFNDNLPLTQDNWVSPFDELYMNIILRLKKVERRLSRLNRV
ncbi:glycosyltransferase family 2 protein [Lapidilactobacillus wuchangensis]|uniref:glycosyltransferase family 2 protein n=1 Tax=Lapidilactobacillus wuchangensis TaxID=2486001 RepID=UPI000F781A7D|nr:glycosyltransferase family 2 protein [Lapidilactobacillus wuchangensis]